jgi:hypothetical protein
MATFGKFVYCFLFCSILGVVYGQASYGYSQSGADWPLTCTTGTEQSPIDILEDTSNPDGDDDDYKVVTQFFNFVGAAIDSRLVDTVVY